MNALPYKAPVRVAFALSALLLAGSAAAEGQQLIMKSFDSVSASGVEWKESKTVPAGVNMVMVYGSPAQAGPYMFRARFPAGYKLAAHKHQDQRLVTVLVGNYWSGVGEAFDQAKLKKFEPRSFYVTEPAVPHFSWAETDVIIQEMGIGPVTDPIEYVNAADDPRKN